MDTQRTILPTRVRTPLVLTFLAALLAAGAPPAAHGASGPSHWLKIKTASRHVTITVTAGYNSSNRGFNFDGYSKGRADFVVPANWTVRFVFSNRGQAPHSLALAKSHGNNPVLAKIGGKHVEIPHATTGISAGTTDRVTFKAKTVGTYYLICAVPGHDAFGMWDYFTISTHAKKPALKIR